MAATAGETVACIATHAMAKQLKDLGFPLHMQCRADQRQDGRFHLSIDTWAIWCSHSYEYDEHARLPLSLLCVCGSWPAYARHSLVAVVEVEATCPSGASGWPMLATPEMLDLVCADLPPWRVVLTFDARIFA
jgi:hypothetical protein